MAVETIATVEDEGLARSLVTALRAYGFHPLERGDGGFPGARGLLTATGIPIMVPVEEARDCRLLAEDLLADMADRRKS